MKLPINILFHTALLACLLSCSKDPKVGSDQATKFIKFFGGSARDSGACVIECPDGGYAITGTMYTSGNKTQAFLIRTDKYGNEFPWSPVLMSNSLNTKGNNVILLNDGSFLISGSVETGANNTDFMVTKIKQDGSISWLKPFGGLLNDEALCALELPNGNLVIGGYSKSISFGGKDEWVINLSSDGDLVWQRNYGGPKDEQCQQILQLKNSSNLILIGTTFSYQVSNDIPNIYIVEIDPTNAFPLGGQNYGGTSKTTGVKGVITDDDKIIVMGNRQTDASSNIEILCLQGIYSLLWEKNIVGTNEIGNDFLFDNNNLYTLGFSGPVSDYNFLIHSLDKDGILISDTPFSGAGNQVISSGIISVDKHLVYTGQNVVNGVSKIVLVKTAIPQ